MSKNVYQELLNIKPKKDNPLSSDEVNFVHLVVENITSENKIYEIGMDFGQRLLALQKEGATIYGGCEFDPMFIAYGQSLFGIQDHNFRLDSFYSINDFEPIEKYDVIVAYKFLNQFDDDTKNVWKNKLQTIANKVILFDDKLEILTNDEVDLSSFVVEDK